MCSACRSQPRYLAGHVTVPGLHPIVQLTNALQFSIRQLANTNVQIVVCCQKNKHNICFAEKTVGNNYTL